MPATRYLDVADDHAFRFTSAELLDSPSKLSLPSALLAGYEKWHGSDFQFYATVSDLTLDGAKSFPSYKPLVAYFHGVLSGLGIMHSMGLAHCDVKDWNIRKTIFGAPLLTDFGITTNGKHHVAYSQSLSFVSRNYPPEHYIDVNMTSSMESHDIYAAGMLLLDWLYYPCEVNQYWRKFWLLSAEKNEIVRQEFARNIYTLRGVAILKNGIDVRNSFSELFLASINQTRETSIATYNNESMSYDAVKVVKSLLRCPRKKPKKPYVVISPRNVTMDRLLVDLALRLMAAEPSDRISVREALDHDVFSELKS